MNLTNEGQPASMAAWEAIGDDGQAELASRAAKRAAYIARSYGAKLTADELWGETWAGIVKRLDAAYLDKHNQQREQLLTLWQVAFRAAHTAAGVWWYDNNKHGNSVPLEDWNGVDGYDMEAAVIQRLTLDECMAGLDSRGKSIMELTAQGYTERETGAAIGVSGVAVHKRIVKMRAALSEAVS